MITLVLSLQFTSALTWLEHRDRQNLLESGGYFEGYLDHSEGKWMRVVAYLTEWWISYFGGSEILTVLVFYKRANFHLCQVLDHADMFMVFEINNQHNLSNYYLTKFLRCVAYCSYVFVYNVSLCIHGMNLIWIWTCARRSILGWSTWHT